MTDPMTMPAMAPFDNPWLADATGADVEDAEDDEVAEDVADEVGIEVAKVMVAVSVGNTTPSHRVSAFEL